MKAGQGKHHMAEFCDCLSPIQDYRSVPTQSQLLSVLFNRLEGRLQGTWRLESSPICRESLWYVCVAPMLSALPSPGPGREI